MNSTLQIGDENLCRPEIPRTIFYYVDPTGQQIKVGQGGVTAMKMLRLFQL